MRCKREKLETGNGILRTYDVRRYWLCALYFSQMNGIDGDVYDNRVPPIACGDKRNAFPSKHFLSTIRVAAAPVCHSLSLYRLS